MRDIDQLSYRKVSPLWCVGNGSKWKTPYFGVPKGFFSYPNLGVSAKTRAISDIRICSIVLYKPIYIHMYIETYKTESGSIANLNGTLHGNLWLKLEEA